MTELVDVVVPPEQLEGTEAVLTRWHVEVGKRVELHAPLLELSTDKVTVEIAAPASGILRETLKNRDEQVAAGDLVARIEPLTAASEAGAEVDPGTGTRAEATGGSPTASTSSTGATTSLATGQERRLSPAVRKLLEKHGLDPAALSGTGRGGRITHQDVIAHVQAAPTVSATRPGLSPPALPNESLAGRMVSHSPMRLKIAEHMVDSALRTAPHVTTMFEADMTNAMAHRACFKPDLERSGIRLTLTAYFVHAAVAALHAVPEVNSRWHEDALELFSECNVGIATALEPEGLIVPVLHGAQHLDLVGLAQRLDDLTTRARSGKLTQREVQNGTFTITNHGVSGSLIATPIINQPQSAILGVGKVQKRVVVREAGGTDTTQIRPMIYVTLTIDHRALDGFKANQFLEQFVGALQAWR